MDKLRYELLAEINGRLEADLLKSFLEANDIPVELFQESVGHTSIPVMIDGLGRVQVFVPKEKIDEARKLLQEFKNDSSEDGEK